MSVTHAILCAKFVRVTQPIAHNVYRHPQIKDSYSTTPVWQIVRSAIIKISFIIPATNVMLCASLATSIQRIAKPAKLFLHTSLFSIILTAFNSVPLAFSRTLRPTRAWIAMKNASHALKMRLIATHVLTQALLSHSSFQIILPAFKTVPLASLRTQRVTRVDYVTLSVLFAY